MEILRTRTTFLARFHASLLVGAALVLLAGAAPASAHTPEVTATCTGVDVALLGYDTTDAQPTPNTLTVTIDGAEAENTAFGAAFAGQYDFADTSIGHTYEVTVDAVDNAFDRSFEGTSDTCVSPAAPADAMAGVRVLPPSCDIPARLELDSPVNATWSMPTAVSGPADYSVVATAVTGHVFPGGATTATFTGHLDGQLDSFEAGCATSADSVPPKPEPVVTSTPVDDVDCATEAVVTATTTVSHGWAFHAESNTWLPERPVTTVTTADRAATAEECPVVVTTGSAGESRASSAASELPSTGADLGWLIVVAGALVAAGASLLLMRRTRRV